MDAIKTEFSFVIGSQRVDVKLSECEEPNLHMYDVEAVTHHLRGQVSMPQHLGRISPVALIAANDHELSNIVRDFVKERLGEPHA